MTTCTEEPAEVGKPNGRIKISIVDDDENYRTLMKHAVDRSHDFECVGSFGGGLEALKGIRSSASDVVLMDVRMPDMPGTECARQLKSIQPHLPIIIISGFDDPHTLAKSMDAGADGFWAKRHPLAPFFGSLAVWLRRRTFGLNETSCPEKFLLVQTKVEASTATVSLPPSSDQFPESTIDGQKTSAEPEVDVASHLPTFRKALQRMVAGLEGNFHARQDLLQEALVYFWSRERQYPGRSGSWYMQGAKFYLQNLRTSGRSLNSTKRRSAQASLPDRCDEWDHWLDTLIFDEGIMSEVQARDLFSLLAGRLKPTDQTILRALDHGLGVCDIAAELKVSHVFVVKRRRLIAKLAIKLGISPLPAGPPRRA